MPKRKFTSEFGLNMLVEYKFLLQQDHLDVVDRTGVFPHIYMIARRPQISLTPDSMVFTKERVTGQFRKQVKDKQIPIPFDVPNMLGTSDVTVKCDYPYTEVAIVDADGETISHGKCALLLGTFGSKYWEHLDLEVLYVGQAFGKAGERTAADRLRNHKTLQGIYSEAMRLAPDQNIWLILLTFQSPMLLASFDGRNKDTEMSADADTDHMFGVLGAEVSEQQRINFTEAALIKYFQPSYNTMFKDSFPNPAHSTYSKCYDIDLNMVSVELQTEDIGARLWSPSAPASYLHLCSFPLHSREERVFMFDFFPTPKADVESDK